MLADTAADKMPEENVGGILVDRERERWVVLRKLMLISQVKRETIAMSSSFDEQVG